MGSACVFSVSVKLKRAIDLLGYLDTSPFPSASSMMILHRQVHQHDECCGTVGVCLELSLLHACHAFGCENAKRHLLARLITQYRFVYCTASRRPRFRAHDPKRSSGAHNEAENRLNNSCVSGLECAPPLLPAPLNSMQIWRSPASPTLSQGWEADLQRRPNYRLLITLQCNETKDQQQ